MKKNRTMEILLYPGNMCLLSCPYILRKYQQIITICHYRFPSFVNTKQPFQTFRLVFQIIKTLLFYHHIHKKLHSHQFYHSDHNSSDGHVLIFDQTSTTWKNFQWYSEVFIPLTLFRIRKKMIK